MRRFINDDPFMPWNAVDADSPFKPWNDVFHKDSPFAPWNSPLSDERDYDKWCERERIPERDR